MNNELDDHSVDEDNEEYVRPTIVWNDEFSFQTDLDVSVRQDQRNSQRHRGRKRKRHAAHVPTVCSRALGQIAPEVARCYRL